MFVRVVPLVVRHSITLPIGLGIWWWVFGCGVFLVWGFFLYKSIFSCTYSQISLTPFWLRMPAIIFYSGSVLLIFKLVERANIYVVVNLSLKF